MKSNIFIHASGLFRPTPDIHYLEQEQTLIITWDWGDPQSKKNYTDDILSILQNLTNDNESTTIQGYSTEEPKDAGVLVACLQTIHNQSFQQSKDFEYQSGCEILILKKHQCFYSWAFVGSVQILGYHNQTCNVLAAQAEWSTENPLPMHLLGVTSSVKINSGSCIADNFSEIFITNPNIDISGLKQITNFNPQSMHKQLVANNSLRPFCWVALS